MKFDQDPLPEMLETEPVSGHASRPRAERGGDDPRLPLQLCDPLQTRKSRKKEKSSRIRREIRMAEISRMMNV
jgi:hypothetical protein